MGEKNDIQIGDFSGNISFFDQDVVTTLPRGELQLHRFGTSSSQSLPRLMGVVGLVATFKNTVYCKDVIIPADAKR